MTILQSREAVLEAAGDNPYTRLITSSPTTGIATQHGVAWRTLGPWGPLTCVIGEERALDALDGPVTGYIHLGAATTRPGAMLYESWDMRWLTAPPPVPGDAAPLAPEAYTEINALLDEAFPTTSTRPSDPRVDTWWGIRAETGELVACGAARTHNDTGYLAGIAVSPTHRGRGLATSLTAAMATHLYARHGAVALGVTHGNPALALYERLGFTEGLPRYSYWFAESEPT